MRRQFKFGTKPLEKKMNQARNVKKLTTSDDAYSPEKMYVVSKSKMLKNSKKSRPRPRVEEKTDLTARKAADKVKGKAYYRKDLPPVALREVMRKEQFKNRKPAAGTKKRKPPPKLKKRRKII